MKRVLLIARREWLEQRRQPAMLGIVATTFALIAGLALATLGLLEFALSDPTLTAQVGALLPVGDEQPDELLRGMVGSVVGLANWLLFTQFLGISAVLAGHSILHDRQTGALPFLLLAPVRRAELLAGKVVGSIGPAMALYLLISGAAYVAMALLPATAGFAQRLPPSPAWLVSFCLGGPAWALFLGTVCAIISSVARDVRTAQQAVWFAVLFASFGCGFLLAVLLSEGVVVQVAVAITGLLCAAGALAAGSQIISRDLGR